MITRSKLLTAHAQLVSYKKGEIIFFERTKASFYFQIETGRVKMMSFTSDGKEVIQKIFEEGATFGEPALMGEFPYPARAVALTNCKIWKIIKKDFTDLLKRDPDLHLTFTKAICERMQYKAIILQMVSIKSAKERILSFIKFLKKKKSISSITHGTFVLPYTRQQLADILGLRVETVIRAVKELEEDGEVQIIKRKICRA